MKLISNTYKHQSGEFKIFIETCNRRLATAKNLKTQEKVKFNRAKLEWMISKGIFVEIAPVMSKSDVMKRAWEIARNAVKKFGGKIKEYFSASLKMAWAGE